MGRRRAERALEKILMFVEESDLFAFLSPYTSHTSAHKFAEIRALYIHRSFVSANNKDVFSAYKH